MSLFILAVWCVAIYKFTRFLNSCFWGDELLQNRLSCWCKAWGPQHNCKMFARRGGQKWLPAKRVFCCRAQCCFYSGQFQQVFALIFLLFFNGLFWKEWECVTFWTPVIVHFHFPRMLTCKFFYLLVVSSAIWGRCQTLAVLNVAQFFCFHFSVWVPVGCKLKAL